MKTFQLFLTNEEENFTHHVEDKFADSSDTMERAEFLVKERIRKAPVGFEETDVQEVSAGNITHVGRSWTQQIRVLFLKSTDEGFESANVNFTVTVIQTN